MKSTLKVSTSKGIVNLSEQDYKASGGQGVVYCKNGVAYKVYHDPKTMIPVDKIRELATLKDPSILSPVVSPTDIAELVNLMQDALEYIHSKDILVVDYNELNFLLSGNYKKVYHIDVDSWQTKNFPATAIMESIRDHKAKKGMFTEGTDWFSFAVITFQMYTGAHPYKGFHPKFAPNEWGKRMEAGISVFDKDVRLPASCQDFSVIPPKHLDWYKDVFIKNNRSVPPKHGECIVAIRAKKSVAETVAFKMRELFEFNDPIKRVFFFNNKQYVITTHGVYCDHVLQKTFLSGGGKIQCELADVQYNPPVSAYLMNGVVNFQGLNNISIDSVVAQGMFAANGAIYTINNNQLIENSFDKIGKIIHLTKVVSNLSPSYKIFAGVVVQDDFMKCHLSIPFQRGKCVSIRINELDGLRVIDAAFMGKVCVLLTEDKGIYKKVFLIFDDTFTSYSFFSENTDIGGINFVSLPNNLSVMSDDDKMTLFILQNKNLTKKEVSDNLISSVNKLYNNGMMVFMTEKTKLYLITMS